MLPASVTTLLHRPTDFVTCPCDWRNTRATLARSRPSGFARSADVVHLMPVTVMARLPERRFPGSRSAGPGEVVEDGGGRGCSSLEVSWTPGSLENRPKAILDCLGASWPILVRSGVPRGRLGLSLGV
eukprot:8682800-Pyramimonas_sp.AAC.2